MKRSISKACFRRLRSLVIHVQIVFPGESHAAVNLNVAISGGLASVDHQGVSGHEV
jgi:hypothetical protein